MSAAATTAATATAAQTLIFTCVIVPAVGIELPTLVEFSINVLISYQ